MDRRIAAGPFVLTRRGLIGGAGAITLLFHELALTRPAHPPLAAARHAHALDPTQPIAGPGWSGPPGQARWRIDGLAKVSGQKIYARDFRAADLPGWPRQERLLMILRAPEAARRFEGLDLGSLPADAAPLLVISQAGLPDLRWPQADLRSLNLNLPFSSTAADDHSKQLLPAVGEAIGYWGQPVALLLFADLDRWRLAKRALQFQPGVVRLGQAQAPAQAQAYTPVNYLTRYEAAGQAPFSQVQVGYPSDPFLPDSASQPYNSAARRSRAAIAERLREPALLQLGGRYRTQVLDPMFMEPESGLAWYQAPASGPSRLHLLLGTQATNGDLDDSLALFKNSTTRVDEVALYACYPGGGFGGRDVSTLPLLLAIAAALSPGHPVRIAQDRYEQFQSGLKQLGCEIEQQIAVDRRSGEFLAFRSRQTLAAGGQNNYSQFVAMLAAYSGLSGYDIRQAYVDAVARPSAGVVAGSMRGFGGPQASWAVETLVDEVAVALRRDPIALRELNVLRQGDRTLTGAPLTQPLRLAEICRLARAHPRWQTRASRRREALRRGLRYGVGFALANQAYGTGSDGVMAEVGFGPDGRLSVRSNCVDMGNGSATTLAIRTASWLGRNADAVQLGDVASFNALQMHSQPGGSWSDPAWTASFAMSSSACLTAFHQVHVCEQASRVLFEAALLPAAAALWRRPVEQLQGRTRWRDGQLLAEGLPALAAVELAKAAQVLGLPSAAMVHGLFSGDWVEAGYQLPDGRRLRLPVDGLALRQGADWQVRPRQDPRPPPPEAHLYGRSLYAPSGALVAVEIDRRERIRVVGLDLYLDAGRVLQPDLLRGQAEGGIAMGIGYALLEELPLQQGGAGDGRWNLDRYQVALAADLPLQDLHIHLLGGEDSSAKGIAEAVLCPIAPAIGNAVAHACAYRQRARSLPIRL